MQQSMQHDFKRDTIDVALFACSSVKGPASLARSHAMHAARQKKANAHAEKLGSIIPVR